MKFTVLTPTYNRKHSIHRVYESLLQQTYRDFEWVIVDDGSSDNTRYLIEKWLNDPQTTFQVRYFWQEHEHKKKALNRGVREARGELLVILDSDDRCVPEALEVFLDSWDSIPGACRDEFSGVCALCVDPEGKIIGDLFPVQDYMDVSPLDIKYIHKVGGEKWGVFRTEILRVFPFREDIPGYVPEHTVWDSIGKRYKTRFINKALRIYYLDTPGIIARQGEVVDPTRDALGAAYGKEFVLSNNLEYFWSAPWIFILEAARLIRYWLNALPRDRALINFWPKSKFGKVLVALAAPVGVILWAIGQWRWRRYVAESGLK